MIEPIDALGVRILGSLIEKEATTPDNYPLTLNALTAACNQTSNRDPVMRVEESAVLQSLEELNRRSLTRALHRSDSRVLRYRHALTETLHLHAPEVAALCVLMLRGPQTAGEIRTRSGRLYEFGDLAQVDLTLQSLSTMATPLVVQLPRRPGQKEVRFAHLLSGEPPQRAESAESAADASERVTIVTVSPQSDRITALEETVASLRAEMAALQEEFQAFRREFQ